MSYTTDCMATAEIEDPAGLERDGELIIYAQRTYYPAVSSGSMAQEAEFVYSDEEYHFRPHASDENLEMTEKEFISMWGDAHKDYLQLRLNLCYERLESYA